MEPLQDLQSQYKLLEKQLNDLGFTKLEIARYRFINLCLLID